MGPEGIPVDFELYGYQGAGDVNVRVPASRAGTTMTIHVTQREYCFDFHNYAPVPPGATQPDGSPARSWDEIHSISQRAASAQFVDWRMLITPD
jgi:hypothetical protein